MTNPLSQTSGTVNARGALTGSAAAVVAPPSTVRRGIRMILEADDDIQVVGEAEDGADAVAQARTLRPHVVLMDLRMPRLDGIEATRRITADPAMPKC